MRRRSKHQAKCLRQVETRRQASLNDIAFFALGTVSDLRPVLFPNIFVDLEFREDVTSFGCTIRGPRLGKNCPLAKSLRREIIIRKRLNRTRCLGGVWANAAGRHSNVKTQARIAQSPELLSDYRGGGPDFEKTTRRKARVHAKRYASHDRCRA